MHVGAWRVPALLACAWAVALAAPVRALEVPTLKAHVNDLAGLLSASEQSALETKLSAHEDATGQQFALLVVPTLDGDAIEDFSIHVVEKWKLGQKKLDNGLLLVVAAQDRKLRIEVGYGLEGEVTDAFTARVMRETLTPAFRQGQYGQGIAAAFDLLIAKAKGEAVAPPAHSLRQRGSEVVSSVLPFLVLLVIVVILFSGGGRGGGGGAVAASSSALASAAVAGVAAGASVGVAAAGVAAGAAASAAAARRGVGEMTILNSQDRSRVEAAIAQLEQRSAAELVVAEVARSDAYLDVRLALAGLFALGASAGVHMLFPLVGIGELLALELFSFALGFGLFGAPAVLRRCLPERRVLQAVQREAGLSFLANGVFATRERSGVLILLSELEHQVVILGDQGIHASVAEDGWNGHVATIVSAIRAGRAADGVCQVIAALGEKLAELAPVRADDTNELPDRVR